MNYLERMKKTIFEERRRAALPRNLSIHSPFGYGWIQVRVDHSTAIVAVQSPRFSSGRVCIIEVVSISSEHRKKEHRKQ